ncbi:MAG: hypothetical protein P2975_03970 [Gemmatimonadota bacterium]|nr:hypothetical protein [Gemmatimonadota bacterium]MDQ8174680.1 hypothetical protein [Gemmatimonadota bacterium]
MVRRRLHPLGTLLAVVALLVAPLRSTVACDMAPEAHTAHEAHVAHEAPASTTEAVDHSAHAGHEMAVAVEPEAPAQDLPTSLPMPCDDWASCAMIALPQVALVRPVPSILAAAPRITLAGAPDAPSLTIEPPPPRG